MTTAQIDIACASCGAQILIEPLMRTTRCPYCDSPAVVDRPSTPNRPDPVFAIGFAVDRKTARRKLRRFIDGKKFAPASIKRLAINHLQGIYVPTYLYSALSRSTYLARIGEDYTEVVIRNKKARTVRKTEYRSLRGRHACYVSDVVVSASSSISNAEVQSVEPFDLRALRRYSPALISGWVSEEPAIDRQRCLELAREESRTAMSGVLRQFMPGDSCRGLRHDTDLTEESIDLTLVPVWVAAIRRDDAAEPIRLLVNGQTGQAHGEIPVSWGTIGLVAAAAAALVALVVILVRLLG